MILKKLLDFNTRLVITVNAAYNRAWYDAQINKVMAEAERLFIEFLFANKYSKCIRKSQNNLK